MRARNIKPGFFENDLLVEMPFEFRLLFIGLWTMADKSGRLEDRPKKIKMCVFPADDVDVNRGLTELSRFDFIKRYEVDGVRFIQVSNWEKHQKPHHTEKSSTIPPCVNGAITVNKPIGDCENHPDSLIPDSLIPDSLIPDSLIPDSLIPDSGLLENTSCPEPLRDSEPDPVKISSPVVLTIPIKGKAAGDYEVTEAAIAEWQEAFPAVDVPQALRSIRQWNLAHPDRQKTRKGIVAHIVGWLDKEQNKPRQAIPMASRASPQQSPLMSDKTIRSMNNLQDWVQQ